MLLLLFMYACTSSNLQSDELLTGNYKFTMKDSLNNNVIEGILIIDKIVKDAVHGTYQITKKHNENFKGLPLMEGKFDGRYNKKDTLLGLNMSPLVMDANIFVTAKVKGTEINGEWNYSTMMGIMDKGSFKAKWYK